VLFVFVYFVGTFLVKIQGFTKCLLKKIVFFLSFGKGLFGVYVGLKIT
jgi:hypothetical protein